MDRNGRISSGPGWSGDKVGPLLVATQPTVLFFFQQTVANYFCCYDINKKKIVTAKKYKKGRDNLKRVTPAS